MEYQVYLVTENRTIAWTQVTRLGEEASIGAICELRGGGRKKKGKKDRNPWNSSEGAAKTPEEGEEKAEDESMREIRVVLEQRRRKSMEDGPMNVFVNQAA